MTTPPRGTTPAAETSTIPDAAPAGDVAADPTSPPDGSGHGDPAAGLTGSGDRRFVGHPLALGTLFSVELWERFSYYGMQTVMAYYLYFSLTDGGLGLPKASATSIIGAYGGFVYLSCVAGAWTADRVLGPERTLFFSACVVMAGHIALALLPGLGGVTVGLVLVAIGSGGVKTSATGVVGSLYRADDPRADAGFSLFYMGVNIGALIGPLITGLLQQDASFHWAFGAAAIGMALGLTVYTIGRGGLPRDSSTATNPLGPREWVRPVVVVAAAAAVVTALFALGVLRPANLSTAVALVVAVIVVALFTLMLRSPQVDPDERSRVRSFIPMFLGSVAFWSLFQQMFTMVEVYSDKRMDRHIGSWEMPINWVTSIEPLWVILLAPLFALLWTKLGSRAPSSPVKFALGAGGMGVAFLLFLPWAGGVGNTTPALALAGILLVFALAELCLSPVGLSLSTRIGPRRFRSQTVALNFLSVSLGSALAGTLAGYYSPDNEGAYFGATGVAAVILSGVLLSLAPWTKRAMRGVR